TISAMQPILSQLASAYTTFKPIVAHVSAVDADHTANFMTDYITPLRAAREAGTAALISARADEVQYMSILASLFSTVLPTLNLYDGVRLARELTQFTNVLSVYNIKQLFDIVRQSIPTTTKTDPVPQLTNILTSFNATLNTRFSFFEYFGHPSAETVLVVLGAAEVTLATTVVNALVNGGTAVGIINVRIYQPFSDADFLVTLPKSTRRIAVLGQVGSNDARSILYEDVLAAIASTGSSVDVLDINYQQQNW